MCGNFGLVMLGKVGKASENTQEFEKKKKVESDMDRSMHQTLAEVSKLHGVRVKGDPLWTQLPSASGKYDIVSTSTHHGRGELLPPLFILQAQTAATEVRGGQAGGISSISYKTGTSKSGGSGFEGQFDGGEINIPNIFRVRCVARKRYPLAADLAQLFVKKNGGEPDASVAVTFIGHTRFATSSVNVVPELHPHEWMLPQQEFVWQMSPSGKYEEISTTFGMHLTHNGDFDALEAYSGMIVVSEVGLFCERVLHTPNSTNGDSPKLCGMMNILRTQGRWAASARLGYVRNLKSANDTCGGEQLSKEAPNTFPGPEVFQQWAEFFNPIWKMHKNNVIELLKQPKVGQRGLEYQINRVAEKAFIHKCLEQIEAKKDSFGVKDWTAKETKVFVNFTIRAFLRNDLYTALTELMSRAEGSFGVQVHCTIEPGVVAIASKGQPMSVSFDPDRSICLYGSEAEAIAVPIDEEGVWLPERIDLDSKGEVMRLGAARALIEGKYMPERNEHEEEKEEEKVDKSKYDPKKNIRTGRKALGKLEAGADFGKRSGIRMKGGIEILSYSLVTHLEGTAEELIDRAVSINSAPIPYDPKADLVRADLAMTPGIIAAIDRAWKSEKSVEKIVGNEFAKKMISCMRHRMQSHTDSTDLIIGGLEASLWVAEQFAADLRSIFPQLNIVTVSSNKLLGLGKDTPGRVFFPGTDQVLARRIDEYTCVLLISQSGQTFGSLHATRKVAGIVKDRLFLLTGCFNSKMEGAMIEDYQARGMEYKRDRVFNNYAGNRPAEPTSAAIVATYHTLTKLMLHLIVETRNNLAGVRMIHKWDYQKATNLLVGLIRKRRINKRRKQGLPLVIAEDTSDPDAKLWYEHSSVKGHTIAMNLTDGCIDDMHQMLEACMMPDLSKIVGYNEHGDPLEGEDLATNKDLREKGILWGEHIIEPWRVIVIVSVYLILSVGFGVTIFHTIVAIILAIIKAGGVDIGKGHLTFSLLDPATMRDQGVGWTLIALGLNFIDAFWFVYLTKGLTYCLRWKNGRPLSARYGKRTIVIVDSPVVHQLAENFCSKLFSQSYSFCGVDVHGASGLDHFVHRFTHRVVRGVLLAVGRPDGRMCVLAKSESAVLLAVKQAAFIQNPAYADPRGSGPEIITIGHNPFAPRMGLCHNVVLSSDTRKKFVDEYIYERLYLATKPFTGSILRYLNTLYKKAKSGKATAAEIDELPYGVQHIDPTVRKSTAFCDFILNAKESGMLTKKKLEGGGEEKQVAKSCDPSVRTAFAGRLDGAAQNVQDYQQIVQQFYECRIASLERYVAFCVMFHAMADHACRPWLCKEWDMARSQSNLRVATTASPIAAEGDGHHVSQEVKKVGRDVASALRGFVPNF